MSLRCSAYDELPDAGLQSQDLRIWLCGRTSYSNPPHRHGGKPEPAIQKNHESDTARLWRCSVFRSDQPGSHWDSLYGKPILPAELVPTDRKQLRVLFPGMPQTVDGHDQQALANALRPALQSATPRKKTTPEHNFLIGMAYMEGIYVERNSHMAVRLILSAARKGLPEAINKLGDMYYYGDCVAQDYETAAYWREKLLDKRKKEYKWNCSLERGILLLEAYRKLAETLRSRKMYVSEQEFLETALSCAEKMDPKDANPIVLTYKTDFCERIEALIFAGGIEQFSCLIYKKLVAFLKKMGKDSETNNRLGNAYAELGFAAYMKRDYRTAGKAYKNCLKIGKSMKAAGDHLYLSWDNPSGICQKLGVISYKEGKPDEGKKWFLQSIKEEENSEDTADAKQHIHDCYIEWGRAALELGELSECKECIRKALEIAHSDDFYNR